MLNVGHPAPDFSLPSSEGKEVSLKNLRGKKIVLYFYPKDDTPGCTKEACSFSENLVRMRKKGALVFGVSADTVKAHKRFIEKYNLMFPLLSDETKKVIHAYGVWKEKKFLGRTYMGIERTTFIIDENGIVSHIFPKVKIDGHTDDVLSSL